jgi:hypothetical protein
MAPELENHWFERTGRRCGAKPTGWQGRLLTALYTMVVTASAYLLVDRTIIGFVVVLVMATAIFLLIAAAKTRGGLGW